MPKRNDRRNPRKPAGSRPSSGLPKTRRVNFKETEAALRLKWAQRKPSQIFLRCVRLVERIQRSRELINRVRKQMEENQTVQVSKNIYKEHLFSRANAFFELSVLIELLPEQLKGNLHLRFPDEEAIHLL